MKVKKIIYLVFISIILFSGCNQIVNEITLTAKDTYWIIWDTDNTLSSHKFIWESLFNTFPNITYIPERIPEEEMASKFKAIFSEIPNESSCIFLVTSTNQFFHEASEWNIWMPDLWRELNCKEKILIADAPWGDEFLNPIKTQKADTIWVINGLPGSLRKKLPNSLLAASCRFDEVNLACKSINNKTETPLFAYYFLENLVNSIKSDSKQIDILNALQQASNLTQSAMDRGVVSEMERMFFFQRSEIEKNEFLKFPHPLIWNGLAKKILITRDS